MRNAHALPATRNAPCTRSAAQSPASEAQLARAQSRAPPTCARPPVRLAEARQRPTGGSDSALSGIARQPRRYVVAQRSKGHSTANATERRDRADALQEVDAQLEHVCANGNRRKNRQHLRTRARTRAHARMRGTPTGTRADATHICQAETFDSHRWHCAQQPTGTALGLAPPVGRWVGR
jgi:hypothetical protein